jgi:hypothetical protein
MVIKIKMTNGDTFKTRYKSITALLAVVENNVGVLTNSLVEIDVELRNRIFINPANISSVEVDED